MKKTGPQLDEITQSMQKLSEVAGATAEQMEQLKAYAEAGYLADDEKAPTEKPKKRPPQCEVHHVEKSAESLYGNLFYVCDLCEDES